MLFDLPPMPDAPPGITHECVLFAAAAHAVPPEALVAIRQQENGQIGTVSQNTNDTADLGVNQINEIHLPQMQEQWGITRDDLIENECVNYFVAAQLVAMHLKRNNGDLLKSLGDYHSKTPSVHQKYLGEIRPRLDRLMSKFGDYVEWMRAGAIQARYALQGLPKAKQKVGESASGVSASPGPASGGAKEVVFGRPDQSNKVQPTNPFQSSLARDDQRAPKEVFFSPYVYSQTHQRGDAMVNGVIR